MKEETKEWLCKWLSVDWFDEWLSDGYYKRSFRNKVLLALAWPSFVIGGISDFILNYLEASRK